MGRMISVVIGVRHRTAPIHIREKLSFHQDEILDALREMLTMPGIVEAAILTTCNRTELYATVTDTELGIRSLKTFLNDYKQFDCNAYMDYTFTLLHEDAVMHLFRVASGLDSLVLGEGQIMAQVKESLKTAMAARSSGELIDKMFKAALTVGKAVRSETGIMNRDISVSRAAFEFARDQHPQFLESNIAVIGAGKMAEILMSSLKAALPAESRRPDQIVLVNRSPDKGMGLSEKFGFPCYGWEEVTNVAKNADTVFVATSSPHYVIHPQAFEGLTKPKVIIDISVPRNVDPSVGDFPFVSLFNTDHLTGYSGYTGENRLRLIQQAHQIMDREFERYHEWLMSRSAIPVITHLREQVETMRRNEVAELEAHCPHVRKSCSVIDELSRTLVNKILHNPTVQMRGTRELEEIYNQAELIARMFNLPSTSSDRSETETEYGQEAAVSSNRK